MRRFKCRLQNEKHLQNSQLTTYGCSPPLQVPTMSSGTAGGAPGVRGGSSAVCMGMAVRTGFVPAASVFEWYKGGGCSGLIRRTLYYFVLVDASAARQDTGTLNTHKNTS